MEKIWRIIHSYAVKKEKERLLFILGVFLRKDGLIRFAQQCNNVDGHSMVSEMDGYRIFSLGLTTFELQQFVYACILKASILVLAGLRLY